MNERPHMNEDSPVDRLADTVADTSRPLSDDDRADLTELLPLLTRYAADEDLALGEDRRLALAAHSLAFVRRMRDGERLDELGPEVFAEVPVQRLGTVRRLLERHCLPRGHPVHETEVLLFSLHFEAARQCATAPDLPS